MAQDDFSNPNYDETENVGYVIVIKHASLTIAFVFRMH